MTAHPFHRLPGKKSKEEADKAAIELAALEKITVQLEAGKGARSAKLTDEEDKEVRGLGLLTYKPLIYAANVSETDLGNQGADNAYVQVGGDLCLQDMQGSRVMSLVHVLSEV